MPSAANFELNDVILVLRSNYRQNSKVHSCINEVHIYHDANLSLNRRGESKR